MIRGFQTVRIVQWRSAAGRLRWASLPDKQATQKLQPVPPGLDIVWTVLTNCVKVLQDPCPRLSHRSFQMYPLYINVCPCSVCGQSMVTTWCFYGVFACPDLRKPAESKASATNPAPSALAPNVWAKCRAVELCPCHVPAIICHHLPYLAYLPSIPSFCQMQLLQRLQSVKIFWQNISKGSTVCTGFAVIFICVLPGRIMILLGWKQTFTKFKHDIRDDHGAIRKAIDSIGNSTGT